jgi:uncharacterized protein YndB with AHSA1/START domain
MASEKAHDGTSPPLAGDGGPVPANPRPADRPDGARAEVSISAPRDVVFARLTDPRTYPAWLVGAQHIRDVDDDWPAPGSAFHHRIGIGPLTVDDATTVVSVAPPDELVLRARIGPLGAALVRFRLVGSEPTVVHFDEAAESGPLRRLGSGAGRWLLRPTIWGRNELSLVRLRDLLEDRAAS